MSQGKWYRLYDKGNGAIKGLDSSYGSASINYATGSIILTTGALPDNGTAIMFYWATPAVSFNRSNIVPANPIIEWNLDHQAIAPNTLTINWNSVSVSDDGNGNLTGTGRNRNVSLCYRFNHAQTDCSTSWWHFVFINLQLWRPHYRKLFCSG